MIDKYLEWNTDFNIDFSKIKTESDNEFETLTSYIKSYTEDEIESV